MAGRFPRPGTKAHLRTALSTAGWEPEAYDKNALSRTRDRLYDVLTEGRNRSEADKIGGCITTLREAGLKVSPLPGGGDKKPTGRTMTLWESLTTHAWWAAAGRGNKSLVLVAKTRGTVERASALFISDLWANLGGEPEHRMPVFRRVSLLSLMSPEALNRYMETIAPNTDLLVVHGGFLAPDDLYQTFGYLSAVESMFKGFLLYEAVADMADVAALGRTAQSTGFKTVLGV